MTAESVPTEPRPAESSVRRPRTQYYVAASIDGFIADADNSLDWLFQFEDESGPGYSSFIADVGAIAMGSTTFEWVRAHLAAHADEGWPYQQPTWVFSTRSQAPIEGADLHFVSGAVAPVHAQLVTAAAGKNIWVVGGGELVGQFHDAGLLDEVILTVASVTLGAGAPLLPRRITSPPLVLLSAELAGPYAALHYRVQH